MARSSARASAATHDAADGRGTRRRIVGITAWATRAPSGSAWRRSSRRRHFIQNLGDGTFFHSGQLAIQAAIGAGVEHHLQAALQRHGRDDRRPGPDAASSASPSSAHDPARPGRRARSSITDRGSDRYAGRLAAPTASRCSDRSEIVEAQEVLADVAGVTVLIHDQACAAELRRARKRGTRRRRRPQRVVINHRICEGCGDCGEVSNCLSVQPIDTPFGRKTAIDQTTCNLDYSCLEGDCPAFMTVEVDGPTALRRESAPPAEPTDAARSARRCRRRRRRRFGSAGIGGTGVVTVAQVLGDRGDARRLAGRGLDQIGLSPEGRTRGQRSRALGAGADVDESSGRQQADVLLAFDLLVGRERGHSCRGVEVRPPSSPRLPRRRPAARSPRRRSRLRRSISCSHASADQRR